MVDSKVRRAGMEKHGKFGRYLESNLVRQCEDRLYLGISFDSFGKAQKIIKMCIFCPFKINLFIYVFMHNCKSKGVCRTVGLS